MAAADYPFMGLFRTLGHCEVASAMLSQLGGLFTDESALVVWFVGSRSEFIWHLLRVSTQLYNSVALTF